MFVIRLPPALFALLGSTFAASAAFAAGQVAPVAAPHPAIEAQPVDSGLSCKAMHEQTARPASQQLSRGRQVFGLANAALQAAGPSFGGSGGSTAMGVFGAIAHGGAMHAAAADAADPSPADQRKRLAALASGMGC